jgi:hypothetical protein
MSYFIWTHNSCQRSSACLCKESHALWTHLDLMPGQVRAKKKFDSSIYICKGMLGEHYINNSQSFQAKDVFLIKASITLNKLKLKT